MKYLGMLRRARPVLAAIVLLGVAFIATGVWWRSSAVPADKSAENKQRLHSRIRTSPEGHFAYGTNGYIFSSPIDLVFDEQTVNRFLDRIEERSEQ